MNSVNGKEQSLERILPLLKTYGAAVVALPFDEQGISNDSEPRLKIAGKIVARCEKIDIAIQDIIQYYRQNKEVFG